MNVQKCENGHFYDADKYMSCPHCGASLPNNPSSHSEEPMAAPQEMRAPQPAPAMAAPVPGFNNPAPALEQAPANMCPSCNKPIVAGARFCRFCGNPVSAPAAAPAPAQAPMPMPVVVPMAMPAPAPMPMPAPAPVAAPAPEPEPAPAPAPVMPAYNETVELPDSNEVELPDDPGTEDGKESLQDQVKKALAGTDGKTVGFFSAGTDKEDSADPVVGWLVCIGGKHVGDAFNIFAGKNSIGRGSSNRIVISKDKTVSREKHLWMIYEPKKREFFVQPGEGSGLSYLNEDIITETKKVAAKDTLELGEGKYILVPLCGDDFTWETYIK